MSTYNYVERLNIILDIAKKLKKFEGKNGQIIDLYKNDISFIEDFKKISDIYIKQGIEQCGKFDFIEIGRTIEYIFPVNKLQEPLFVIRFKS